MKKKEVPILPQDQKALKENAATLESSIQWWINEMEKIDKDMDALSLDDPEYAAKVDAIEQRMKLLDARAQMELRNIDNWFRKYEIAKEKAK
jgi:hypothetical protein